MQHQIAKRKPFGNFQSTLYLVHGGDALALFEIGNRNRHFSGAAAVHTREQGSVHRMQGNPMVREPLRHVAHVVRIIVVEMLASCEDLNLMYPDGQDLVQYMRVQALLHKEVCGESEV